MDSPQEFQTTNMFTLDDAEYEDDDVFYSELRKQVLLLTAEDDDDDQEVVHGNKNLSMVAVKKGGLGGNCSGRCNGDNFNWPRNEGIAAPAWVVNQWRSGNGTGVFIPQIVQNKKNNRPRRKRNGSGRIYRSIDTN